MSDESASSSALGGIIASARTLAAQRASLVTELRDELMAEYVGDGPQGLTTAIRDRVKFNPLGEEVMSYATAQGRVVAGNLPVWPRAANGRTHWLETNLRRTGDRRLRNALVESHRDLAMRAARRFANRGEPLDDLVQVAMVGLLKSVERFDPARGLAFSSFAMPTIAISSPNIASLMPALRAAAVWLAMQ